MQLLAAKFNAIATEIDTTLAAIAELQASRARASGVPAAVTFGRASCPIGA